MNHHVYGHLQPADTGNQTEDPAMGTVTFRSLADVVENVDNVDRRLIMYAVRPWTAQSPIWAAHLDEIDGRPDGFEYMLEVDLAKAAIEVWSSWRDDQVPTTAQACGAVIWYAEHDAWQPVERSDQDPDYMRSDLDESGHGDPHHRR